MNCLRLTNDVYMMYDDVMYSELCYDLHTATDHDRELLEWICSFLFV